MSSCFLVACLECEVGLDYCLLYAIYVYTTSCFNYNRLPYPVLLGFIFTLSTVDEYFAFYRSLVGELGQLPVHVCLCYDMSL